MVEMSELFPVDASCWDLGVQEPLPFLDEFITRQVYNNYYLILNHQVSLGLVPNKPYQSRMEQLAKARKTSKQSKELKYVYEPSS